jgi:uncharacterized membrane protein YecN with MAPEG domain
MKQLERATYFGILYWCVFGILLITYTLLHSLSQSARMYENRRVVLTILWVTVGLGVLVTLNAMIASRKRGK